jgi:O-antigen/teichoic acid export membrane protein
MQLLCSKGKPETSAILLFCSVVITVLLCWLLIPSSGIIGAAWASTLSNVFLLITHYMIVKQKFGVKISRSLLVTINDVRGIIGLVRGASLQNV